ncbi:hypothetical protein DPMN_037443 [Dreissena polymorpha]|uniref:Uncharacterized protein n=1 Tax=Dreissena polymorpha TaxID=45954 RepID=A0A9D4RMC2_DREPO|nr:hypothetical protein DPMN_037443 [Dreissena polymorpha]
MVGETWKLLVVLGLLLVAVRVLVSVEVLGVPNYSNFDRTPLSINRSFGNRPLMKIRCAEDMSAFPPHAEILFYKDAIDELLLEHQGSFSKLS